MIILAAIGGCGSQGSEEPDLVPSSVRELHCPLGCAPLKLEVCLDNLGDGDASAFDVTVNDSDRAEVADLSAGEHVCVEVIYGFGAKDEPVVQVDSLDQVAESDESNNTLTFPHPSGTACDIICVGTAARPFPTPPPPRSI